MAISGRLGTPNLSSMVGTMRSTFRANVVVVVAFRDSSIILFVLTCISPGGTQTIGLLRDLEA